LLLFLHSGNLTDSEPDSFYSSLHAAGRMLGTRSLAATASKAPPTNVIVVYALFLGGAFAMYHLVAAGEFSSILTMAVMFQCLAFALLGMQTFASGSSVGISARALGLDAVALVCRLSSTTWLQGYLPVDESGDWFYQAVDICSLVTVLWLLHRVLVAQRSTYQANEDSFPFVPMMLVAFLLASLLHADMNARPLFDALWMAGLFVSVFAVLPQLWLINQNGGKVDSFTAHYIAAMALSRAVSGIFMWYARFDITCVEWVDGFSHAIWAILSAHFLHMVLLADFAYYYVKGVTKQGLACTLELGSDLV